MIGSTLELVHDAAGFLAAPIGRCILGSTYLVWCAGPALVGSIEWGVADERAVRELGELLECVHHRDMARKVRVLADCLAVERVDGEVLLERVRLAAARLPAWSTRVGRHAIVVPGGITGVLLAGALPSLGATHPLLTTRSLDAACAYLDPTAAIAHAAATAIARESRSADLIVARLRTCVARDLKGARIGRCANTLGLSTRTLQRELLRAGTTFSDELRRTRAAAAEELLRLSALKVEAVAIRVGYHSSSRLGETLHRERSATAGELRARAWADGSTAANTANTAAIVSDRAA